MLSYDLVFHVFAMCEAVYLGSSEDDCPKIRPLHYRFYRK